MQENSITQVIPFTVPGKGVWWDNQSKTITFAYTDEDGYIRDRLSIKIGENQIKDFDQTIKIDNPAILSNGRVFVPLRGISEAYGRKVHWKSENGKREVYISGIVQ